MSHFAVLVIGENYEEQMAPYQENNMGDCPTEYLEFIDKEDEIIKEYNEGSSEMVKMPDGSTVSRYDNRAIPYAQNNTIKVPFKQSYPTIEKFAEEYIGYKKRDEKKNRYGYWENPNAKWDYYKVGGRWMGLFKLKKEVMDRENNAVLGQPSLSGNNTPLFDADSCKKGEIDWEGMKKERNIQSEKDYDECMSSINERDKNINYFMFGILPNESKEEFVNRNSGLATYALVKNGKWYEKGKMGWWGMSTNEMSDEEWKNQFNKLIDDLPDDTLLTIVDCHI